MKSIFILLVLLSDFIQAQEVKSFRNKDVTLFYEEFGKGPALYILTGGPGAPPEDPSYRIIDSLKAFYTLVILHQRGSGRSRNIPINESTISIKKYLEDIELLRQTRKDRNMVLLGISWGGLLAMNYAVLYPQHVSRLVLIGSAPPSYTLWPVLFDNQFVRHSSSELDSMNAYRKIFSVKTDRELDSMKSVDPRSREIVALKNFIRLHIRAMHYERNKLPEGFDDFFVRFNFQPIPLIDKEIMETKWDITRQLKKINTPALILYGRQDDQGESTFFLQKECLKNSRIQVIEQCGHIIWEDQPEAFFRALRNYLIPIGK
jgi:proline iminopeptidase